jgi:lipoprotein NlpD
VGAARGAGTVEARPLDAASASREGQGDGGLKTSPKALRLPYSEQNVAMLSKGEPAPKPAAAAAAPKPAAEPERDPEAIEFIWPVRGRVLNGFAEPASKGVDIAGKLGDPVLAAAPGRVMYTGTGIRGYGKLIVIKHDNGFNSVYAHNREILVKEGQPVTRGQRIAELGDTDAEGPRLHFEIRKSGKPVDPMRYLPPPS